MLIIKNFHFKRFSNIRFLTAREIGQTRLKRFFKEMNKIKNLKKEKPIDVVVNFKESFKLITNSNLNAKILIDSICNNSNGIKTKNIKETIIVPNLKEQFILKKSLNDIRYHLLQCNFYYSDIEEIIQYIIETPIEDEGIFLKNIVSGIFQILGRKKNSLIILYYATGISIPDYVSLLEKLKQNNNIILYISDKDKISSEKNMQFPFTYSKSINVKGDKARKINKKQNDDNFDDEEEIM